MLQFEINEFLAPESYARACGISILLAKHSFVLCENRGLLCRDESVEGLHFYSSKLFYEDVNEDEDEEAEAEPV